MKHLSRYLIPSIFKDKLKNPFKTGYIWIDSLYDDMLKMMPSDIEENGMDDVMSFEIVDNEILVWVTGFVWEYAEDRQSAGSLSCTFDMSGKFKVFEFDGLDLDDDSVKGKVIHEAPN